MRNLFNKSILILVGIVVLRVTSPALDNQKSSNGIKEYSLKSGEIKIIVIPETFQLSMEKGKNPKTILCDGMESPKKVEEISASAQGIQWEYTQESVKVQIVLEKDKVLVNFHKDSPGKFLWPMIKGQDSMKGLIWPHNEGMYIPSGDTMWSEFLAKDEWNTLEGLSMPFWGMDYGDYQVTYIITNPFQNLINFERETHGLKMMVFHEVPPNQSEKDWGYQITLTHTQSPVESAKIFRSYLMGQKNFTTLEEKIKKVPRVEKLLGAPHAYLWGGDILTQYDVSRKNWPLFCKKIISESTSENSTVGKRIKSLINESCWKNIEELAKTPYPYTYLMDEISSGISLVLTNPNFIDKSTEAQLTIPKEVEDLVKLDRGSLSKTQIVKINSYLLYSAYTQYVTPVDSWGDGVSVKMLNAFKKAGLDKFVLCLDGWEQIENKPWVADTAEQLGYLMGTYDSYHSIHDPKLKGTNATWGTAQFDQALFDTGGITNSTGTRPKGFKQKGYKLNTEAVWPYVQKRVGDNMKNVGYSYYFVDCDAFGEYYDDYTPGRTITQRGDVQGRLKRLQWISDTYKVPVGSEGGNYLFANTMHIAEGIYVPSFGWGDKDLSEKTSKYYLGVYYPPSGPDVFVKQVPLKEIYAYYFYDPRFKLPLYETVFHDSLITSEHWSAGSLKFSNVWKTNAITEMLYQVPPLYHLNQDIWTKYKNVILAHYKYFSPVHIQTGILAMTDFQWISPDRMIQKATFGDTYSMVANYSEKGYGYENQSIPAHSILIMDLKNKQAQIYTP